MKQRVATDEKPFKSGFTDDSGQETSSQPEPAAALVVPPDGGWGWVVVFASFMCNFLVDGILLSGGALVPSIRDEFKTSEGKAALINSLLAGFYLLCGPFVSALANRYGFRVVTIAGTLISVAGFVVSYYATSIEFLYISYGIVGGIGFCMIFMPAVLTVGFYFEKWRALATGLALCGSGVGTFVMSPFISSLVDQLGWRKAILCQAGSIMLCIVFGALFRPLKPVTVVAVEEPVIDEDEKERAAVAAGKLKDIMKLHSKLQTGISMPPDKRFSGAKATPHTWMGVSNNTRYPTAEEVFRGSTVGFNTQRRSSATAGTIKGSPGLKPAYETVSEKDEHEDSGTHADKASQPLIGSVLRIVSATDHHHRQRASVADTVTRPLYRDDIFFGASLSRLPQYRSRTSIGYHLAVTHVPSPEDAAEQEKKKCTLCPIAVRRALATLLDVSLFKSVTFLILAFAGFFTMMGFFVPFMYVQNRGIANHMPEEAIEWLVSSIGVANIVGRVACGLVSAVPKISPLWVNNIALTIGGIITMVSGISYNVTFQYTFCVIFGLCVACFASLRSIIIVEYLGLERLTNCFGLFLLLQGAGALLSAPVAGALFDSTQSYDISFYVAGGLLIFSALLCYPIDRVSKWEKRRSMQTQNTPAV